MSRTVVFQLWFSLVVLILALVLNWLVLGETSPLGDYFFSHDGLPSMWGAVNIIPGIASIVVSRSDPFTSDIVFYVAFVIQWFVVGVILSFVALLFRMKREKPATLLDSGTHFQ